MLGVRRCGGRQCGGRQCGGKHGCSRLAAADATAAGSSAVSTAVCSLAGGAAVSTAAISGSKRRQLRCQVPRQVPWRQPNGGRQPLAAVSSAAQVPDALAASPVGR